MTLDTLLLSRAQFGFTVGFHILFPTLNIGLGLFLAVMEGLWLKTKNPEYKTICQFWTKIFALTFGMGVVSGIVMSYELGTNFSRYTDAVGGVLGSLFTYEVLSAFFLEAGFLGVMLFGWEKVGKKLHFAATLLVSVGTIISAFWIMSANSWMQTPAGFEIINGKFVPTNWWQIIFNPSFMPRYLHMMFASFITCCFVVAGVSAWYLLKKRHQAVAQRCFSFTLTAGLLLAALQVAIGDEVGLDAHRYQPLKTAAMEGLWHTTKGAPLVLFAIPDEKKETNLFSIEIPKGASLINTHQLDGELTGLTSVPASDRPVITGVFYAFRVMAGIGFLYLGTALYALVLRMRDKLFTQPWFYRWCIAIAPLGFIAAITGWLTAEWGRQPWTVYGFLRTADSVSLVTPAQVFTSFVLLFLVYGVVFSFYLIYLFKLIAKGPDDETTGPTQNTETPPDAFQYMTKS